MKTDIHKHTQSCSNTHMWACTDTDKHIQTHSYTPSTPDSCPSYIYTISLAQLFYLVKGDSAWLHCCPRLKLVSVS